MSTQVGQDFFQCNNCGHVVNKEEEVICWKCGEGEMCYQGKFWSEAEGLPCPTWWDVLKEDISITFRRLFK